MQELEMKRFTVVAATRAAQVDHLLDGSTENYWESEGNSIRTNVITLKPLYTSDVGGGAAQAPVALVAIYVDNAKDKNSQVQRIELRTGESAECLGAPVCVQLPKAKAAWVTLAPEQAAGVETASFSGVMVMTIVSWPQMRSVRLRQIRLFAATTASATASTTALIDVENVPTVHRPSTPALARAVDSNRMHMAALLRQLCASVLPDLMETQESDQGDDKGRPLTTSFRSIGLVVLRLKPFVYALRTCPWIRIGVVFVLERVFFYLIVLLCCFL